MTPADRSAKRVSTTLNAWLENLSNTRRGRKQLLAMGTDSVMAVLALWLAYTIRHGQPFSDFVSTWHLFVLMPILTVVIFSAMGIYRWVVRSSNRRFYVQVCKASLLVALSLGLALYLFPADRSNPRSLFVIFGLLLMFGSSGARALWQGLFYSGSRGERVAIYGAGSAGQQLAGMMHADDHYRPMVFLDDSASVQGTTVSGLAVLDPARGDLKSALAKREISRIVLAMPSLGAAAYRERLEAMKATGIAVQTLPQLSELIAGKVSPADIRDVSIKDILGRSEVPPDEALLGGCIRGLTVMVTGGGGSIGSELCRQILMQNPKKLVVVDNSEANLYYITEDLNALVARTDLEADQFVPVLESVTNAERMQQLMHVFDVNTVYHAAAYKHVPIVEAQPEKGAEVNIFGTRNVLDAAVAHGARHFVLISTDKAVRPTNAMGASKRVAELILQAKAQEHHNTQISMVRFGNVLGSSGSVVPKFKQQIKSGGPITITHPDITRYFMTIPEAAQLVMQASAIARGGEVFVLDMGEPMRIVDLAESMVRLYGKKLQSETGDSGDIAIKFSGLRPGEKMYEEMFLSGTHRRTKVDKVFMASEAWLPDEILTSTLMRVATLAAKTSRDELRALFLAAAFLDIDELKRCITKSFILQPRTHTTTTSCDKEAEYDDEPRPAMHGELV